MWLTPSPAPGSTYTQRNPQREKRHDRLHHQEDDRAAHALQHGRRELDLVHLAAGEVPRAIGFAALLAQLGGLAAQKNRSARLAHHHNDGGAHRTHDDELQPVDPAPAEVHVRERHGRAAEAGAEDCAEAEELCVSVLRGSVRWDMAQVVQVVLRVRKGRSMMRAKDATPDGRKSVGGRASVDRA
jgi:hypothetical protein